jgi:hypothetical protein
MQVCSPQDIRQAHSQNPPNSRVSLEKPLSLTWLRTEIIDVTNDSQKQNVLLLGIEVHSMLSAAASKANKPEDDFIQTDQANACE